MCKTLKNLFKRKKNKPTPIYYKTYYSTSLDEQIRTEINNWRESWGLSRLRQDISIVDDIAGAHANWLYDQNLTDKEFEERCHDGFPTREEQIKLRYSNTTRIGENIAGNFHVPDMVVKAWGESQSHADIMSGDYTHVAIATCAGYVVTIYTKR